MPTREQVSEPLRSNKEAKTTGSKSEIYLQSMRTSTNHTKISLIHHLRTNDILWMKFWLFVGNHEFNGLVGWAAVHRTTRTAYGMAPKFTRKSSLYFACSCSWSSSLKWKYGHGSLAVTTVGETLWMTSSIRQLQVIVHITLKWTWIRQ